MSRSRVSAVFPLSCAACFAFAILVSCSATLPIPNETDLQNLPTEFSRYTLADLHSGRDTYVANCGGCHRLYTPRERTDAEWIEIYLTMKKKVNIAGQEEEKLLAYLHAFSKKTQSRR